MERPAQAAMAEQRRWSSAQDNRRCPRDTAGVRVWRRLAATNDRPTARRFNIKEETMIRLTVLYPAKDGETFNYDYYFNDHHKLLVSRWKPEGMVSCEFDKGMSDPAGGKAPYLAIAYLKFNSVEDLQKALAKHGAEVVGDVANYTKIEPIMQVNEVMVS
jgi:uncharacterized protein (TIGR02118 family)